MTIFAKYIAKVASETCTGGLGNDLERRKNLQTQPIAR